MSKTLNSVPYILFSVEKDAVTFRDSANDGGVSYKRSAPKRTKDFPGMEKSEVKHTVTDPTVGVIGILTISTSIRADATDAQKAAIVATGASLMADAAYLPLVQGQQLPLNG